MLYGAPLRELFATLAERLGLTQARLAEVCGLSPPMVSQLAGARRVKIGNPVAMQRLHALMTLAEEVADGHLTSDAAAPRIAEIASQAGVLTTRGTTTAAPTAAPVGPVRTVQGVFRAVAGAAEYLAAAAAVEDGHPEIARMLRAYGAGRTQDAIEHFTSYGHLI